MRFNCRVLPSMNCNNALRIMLNAGSIPYGGLERQETQVQQDNGAMNDMAIILHSDLRQLKISARLNCQIVEPNVQTATLRVALLKGHRAPYKTEGPRIWKVEHAPLLVGDWKCYAMVRFLEAWGPFFSVRRLTRAIGDKTGRFRQSFSGKTGAQNLKGSIKRSGMFARGEMFWTAVDLSAIYPFNAKYKNGVPRFGQTAIDMMKQIARQDDK